MRPAGNDAIAACGWKRSVGTYLMATEKKPTTAQPSLRITLKRSPIGTPYKHRLVLRGLGLRKLNATVSRPASDQVKGMIAKVGYLLEVSPQ